MPTLTLDLDDQVSDGLATVNEHLDAMAAEAEKTATSTDVLTKAQERQVIVIRHQTALLNELAHQGLRVVGEAGVQTVHVLGAVTAATAAASIGAAKYAAATDMGHTAKNFVMQKAAWKGVEIAAEAAGGKMVGAFLGLGGVFAGFQIGMKVNEMLMARTGLKMVELADGTKKLESNLDRTNAAWGKFSSTVSSDAGRMVDTLSEITAIPLFDFGWWKAFDDDFTRRTEFEVENIGLLKKGYEEVSNSVLAYMASFATGKSVEFHKAEAAGAREQGEAYNKLLAQRQKEAAGTANLKELNATLEQKEAARGETARLTSIKSVKGIDDEIRATRERVAKAVQAGKFDDEAQDTSEKKLTWLAERRITVAKQVEDHAKKVHEAKKARYTEEMKMSDERSQKQMELFKTERARVENLEKMNIALNNTLKDQAHAGYVTAAKEQLAIDKQITEQQMKKAGAKDPAIKAQLAEMDKAVAQDLHRDALKRIDIEAQRKLDAIKIEREKNEKTGGDAVARATADAKLKADADKILFDRRKARIEETGKYQREVIADEAARFREMQSDKLNAEKARLEKVKELVNGSFDAKKVMGDANPKSVLKAIQDKRAQAAMEARSDKDHKLFERGEMGDESAMRRYDNNVKQAGQRARREAAKDFANNNIKEPEFLQAQSKAASETIQTMQKNGKLSADQTKVMIENLKVVADQQQAIEQMANTLEQVSNFQKGIKSAAKKSVQATQNQLGGMGQ